MGKIVFSEYSNSYAKMISYENNTMLFNFMGENALVDSSLAKLAVLDAENNLTFFNMSFTTVDGAGDFLTCDLSSLKAGEYKIFFVVEGHIAYDAENGTLVRISDINNLEEYKNENIFYTIHIEE